MLQQTQIDLSLFQHDENEFAHLSLKDLIAARDLFHLELMRRPNVVATAVGRYRIRKADSWPHDKKKKKGSGVRRLDNSEIRPYSWPCILVFVSQWESPKAFASRPDAMVPKTFLMPNGSHVPVCVIEAPRESRTSIAAPDWIPPSAEQHRPRQSRHRQLARPGLRRDGRLPGERRPHDLRPHQPPCDGRSRRGGRSHAGRRAPADRRQLRRSSSPGCPSRPSTPTSRCRTRSSTSMSG